jgi:membrane protein implicated in regulation of membrane protease activity
VALGPLFAAILAANALLLTGLAGALVTIGFVFFAVYGPFVVWVIRRNIGRWDAAHPAESAGA